jgi:hypothetical protein
MQNRLLPGEHRHGLGVQAHRAALVAGEEGLAVEDQAVGPDPDRRARFDRAVADQRAVEARPVAGPEVAQLDPAVGGGDLRMEAGDVGVRQHDVVALVAADSQALTVEGDRLRLGDRHLA